MQAMIRLGHRLPTPLFGTGLAVATLISLTAGTRRIGPSAVPSDKPGRIVVNSLAGTHGGEPGKITLPDALARAAADPADNVIQFEPALSVASPLTIRLANAVTVEGKTHDDDRIDGSNIAAGVVLEFADTIDAGITIGDGRQLTVSNLTLRGGRQRAILLKDNAQLTLERAAVCGSSGPGLAAFGQARLIVIGGSFTGNATHGVELHGQCAATLSGVEIAGNGQSGLAGFDQAGFAASECRLHGNGEWNVVLTHNSRAEMNVCSLRQGRFAGIDMSDSGSLRCRECTIEESGRFGVFATGSSSAELVKTRVRRSGGRGIELQDHARLGLSETTIDANDDYGVILFGQSSIVATRSVFSGNAAHGVSLRGPSRGEFVGCVFTRNRYSGVGCLDASDGGRVRVSQCVFSQNGMRPIYRGPLHIEPLVPTPISVNEKVVECLAEPNAVIELYLDSIGEAARFLRTTRADSGGRFEVSCAEVPHGFVMTASATSNGSTSEFNVVAGSASDPVLAALLGRTGPFSDEGGKADYQAVVRRWKPGTHLTFQLAKTPTTAVERYVRFLGARIPEWTGGALTADVRVGPVTGRTGSTVIVPIRYLGADSPQLQGRGGVTFMKWDTAGYFQTPMEIVLALGADVEDTCPRVLAHEVGHALGLNHTRVGLLSRMQGSTAPGAAFLNDFSPTMTYYDVLALQVLHDPRSKAGTALGALITLASQPRPNATAVAEAQPAPAAEGTSFSPPDQPPAAAPTRGTRGR